MGKCSLTLYNFLFINTLHQVISHYFITFSSNMRERNTQLIFEDSFCENKNSVILYDPRLEEKIN